MIVMIDQQSILSGPIVSMVEKSFCLSLDGIKPKDSEGRFL